jgi:hypothetical protein
VAVSPRIIDIDTISARPAGADDLVKDQPQIDQAPGGLGTSGAQVPESSSSSPRLPRREINWNGTPRQDDIFDERSSVLNNKNRTSRSRMGKIYKDRRIWSRPWYHRARSLATFSAMVLDQNQ